MKKKTRLFRHFISILHALALSMPILVFGFIALQDSLPKFFSSQAVQHHGGASDVFSDDLDYSLEQLQTRTYEDYFFETMDGFNYINYDANNSVTDLDSWRTYYEGKTFSTINTDGAVSFKLIFNLDFVGLFDNGLVNVGGSASFYLFLNFYLNYLIVITLVCFLPEIIILFFDLMKKLIYKFTDEGEY